MTVVEMQVNMDCAGCESKVRRALTKLRGVHAVEIDRARNKVTVTGSVEQKKVLKKVRSTGRAAVLWPYPFNPEYHHPPTYAHARAISARVPMAAMAYPKANSYNYHVHGYYDSDMHGYTHHNQLARFFNADVPSAMQSYFSDDNPNACSIM